jgi:acyl carrier protein
MVVNNEELEKLVGIIREVKPSLVGRPVRLEDSLVENLGLDSLDVTQLARKVRRIFGNSFDPQGWAARNLEHKYSVKSLLDAAVQVPASEVPGAATQPDSHPTGPPSQSVTGP